MNRRNIGQINNYYGGLSIRNERDKYFWALEDWSMPSEEEIPEYLFNALNKYQDELDNQQTED